MPRYIDADKVEKEIKRRAFKMCAMCDRKDSCTERRGSHRYCWMPVKFMQEDAQEVKHGYWETCGMFDDFVRCSVCKEHKMPMSMLSDYKFNGCPNCLARMDGEQNA